MKKAGKAVVLMTALAVTGALLGGCAGGTADSKTEAGQTEAGKTEAGKNAEDSAQTEAAGGNSAEGNVKEDIRVVTYFAGSDAYAPVWKEVCADYMKDHPASPSLTSPSRLQEATIYSRRRFRPIWQQAIRRIWYFTIQARLIRRPSRTQGCSWISETF